MAEAFITAIHSASEEANSPQTTPSRSDKNEKSSVKQTGSRKKRKVNLRKSASSTCAKEIADETETISTTGLSLNVENELRAEISSVKETVNSVNSRMDICYLFSKSSFLKLSFQVDIKKRTEKLPLQRYSVVDKDSLDTKNVSRDILGDIFGEDTKTKPDKSEGGIVLNQKEYRASFPVSDKSAEILNLPKLDDITQTLLCKRHGPNAGKAHNKLYSKPEKIFENMAFKSQKATLLDTGLEDITELNDKFLSLKLSSDGVLGKDFEEKLKNRSETNKQIKDLLPELNRKSTASTSSFKMEEYCHLY
ncbi:unnamed protein product [Mytilus coruscus]|uniref:Uncharacterized protein n=1 Tax=Mytilus coruscus TaxID=42192 RepID=A0A6J8DZX4_MYTCO|nr:unnamed protein product [Mytilus coruscus]